MKFKINTIENNTERVKVTNFVDERMRQLE